MRDDFHSQAWADSHQHLSTAIHKLCPFGERGDDQAQCLSVRRALAGAASQAPRTRPPGQPRFDTIARGPYQAGMFRLALITLLAFTPAAMPAKDPPLLTWPDLAGRPQPSPDATIAYGDDSMQKVDIWLPAGKGPFPHGRDGPWRVLDDQHRRSQPDELDRRRSPQGRRGGMEHRLSRRGSSRRRLSRHFP